MFSASSLQPSIPIPNFCCFTFPAFQSQLGEIQIVPTFTQSQEQYPKTNSYENIIRIIIPLKTLTNMASPAKR